MKQSILIDKHAAGDGKDDGRHLKHAYDQFNTLCNNVQGASELTNDALKQVYSFHQEYSETLPQFTPLLSKLQDSISHLLTQVGNMVEISKLYAEAFHKENSGLTRVEEKNEMLLRELDIAVRKLDIMSARNDQLELQCMRNKWERLFLKVANFKEGSIGWRHVVHEYKKKLNRNESVAYLFRNLDAKEKCGRNFERNPGTANNRETGDMAGEEESYIRSKVDCITDRNDWINSNSFENNRNNQRNIPNLNVRIKHHVSPDPPRNVSGRNSSNRFQKLSIGHQNSGDPSENDSISNQNNISTFENISGSHQDNLNSFENINDSHWNESEPLENFVRYQDEISGASIEEELIFDSNLGESSVFEWISKNSAYEENKSSNILINDANSPVSPVKAKSKLSVPSKVSLRPPSPSQGVSDKSEVPYANSINRDFFQSDCTVSKMADVSTSTEELCNYFHVRIINPPCLNGEPLFYIVNLDNEVKSGYFHVINTYDYDASLEYSHVETEPNIVKEFSFDLQSNSDCIFEKDRLEGTLRIALHETPASRMLAFTSTNIKELNACSEQELEDDEERERFFNKLELHFSCDDLLKDLNCSDHLVIACSISQKVKSNFVEKSTETDPYAKIAGETIENELQLYRERCHDACTETTERVIYTENEISDLKKQLAEFRKVGARVTFDKNVVNDSSMKHSEKCADVELPTTKMNSKSRKFCQSSNKEFLARLNVFQEESEKNHEKLQKKIRGENAREISKRLEAENKLYSLDGNPSSSDNCLPAVFMPIKNNLVYKVKARSYFHPSNQIVRITQTPTIFQLPELRKIKSGEVLGISVEVNDSLKGK